ncbi:MAG: hypothetical protein HYT88_01815, partial [Candidatus Omnitrophica bacterium]|nr:hypothetical protein [Candidatus Omnitrophota bacterium]
MNEKKSGCKNHTKRHSLPLLSGRILLSSGLNPHDASVIFLVNVLALVFGQESAVLAAETITIDPATTYQTITGWEATSYIRNDDPNFSIFKDHLDDLFSQAADLGINRVRLEMRSGMENSQDYWTQYYVNQSIPYDLVDASGNRICPSDNSIPYWRYIRYTTKDDNGNAFRLDPDPAAPNDSARFKGFHFPELDHSIDYAVLPLKQAVKARGGQLHINLNYVAFTRQICTVYCTPSDPDCYHHTDIHPSTGLLEEYAEAIEATFLHMQNKYSFVPDTVEIILEPDNVPQWNGTGIARAILATQTRLASRGFSPKFVAPSNTNMGGAVSYFDQMDNVMTSQQITQYLEELSYHRYSGVSDANLQAIASRAVQYGINTSMLEHIGSGYQDLHKDLTLGRNSAWSQYVLAGDTNDVGGKYFLIDIATPPASPTNPVITMGRRTKVLRQYFKFIHRGAVRIGVTSSPTFNPVAFINPDGTYVVVAMASAGADLAIQGLPAGTYGITFTSANSNQYDVQSPDVTINPGGTVTASLSTSGVVTIYG